MKISIITLLLTIKTISSFTVNTPNSPNTPKSCQSRTTSWQANLSQRQMSPSSNPSKRPSTILPSTVAPIESKVSSSQPLRVTIAGAGVGGLALANCLKDHAHVSCRVVEKTSAFRRFGGPIQLASNALQVLKEMDSSVYGQVQEKFTNTGDKENGIKDGIRDEWYAKFDLATPAEARSMPYTGVIDRPDLQEIFLQSLPQGTVTNGAGVKTYEDVEGGGLKVHLDDGTDHECDVLIGADGIWSAVRASMRDEVSKGRALPPPPPTPQFF